MSVNALSSHRTLVDVQLTPGGAWTEIAEQKDITVPGMSRNEFETTTQNEDIDSYQLGVLRRNPLKMGMNFIPTNATQDHIAGLQKLMINNTMTGWRVRYPDVAATSVIASGQVQAIGDITAAVDGTLSSDVTIRFSGKMIIGGVTVGA